MLEMPCGLSDAASKQILNMQENQMSIRSAGDKQVGEPAVQQYLWQARKKHDFKVPVKQTAAGPELDTYISAAGVRCQPDTV